MENGSKLTKQKILLVGPYPPPYGGIASHLEGLVPAVSKKGLRVVVFKKGQQNKVSIINGAKIIEVNILAGVAKLLDLRNIVKNIRSLFLLLIRFKLGMNKAIKELIFLNNIIEVIEEEKIDLASYYSMLNGYSIPLLRRVYGINIPIILTIYGAIYEQADYFIKRKKLVKSILDNCDKVFSSSNYCARSVELLDLDSLSIKALYYGIDLTKFAPNGDRKRVRTELNIGLQQKILIFVGRMSEEMGLDSIFEIFPDVLSQRKDVVFVVVGARGILTEQAMALEKEYPEKFRVKVNVKFDDLPYYYAASDIVLAPTRDRHACMGMAIKEGMASGKPTIGSATGGIVEAIVDGETGILVPAAQDLKIDKKAFIEAICHCLNNLGLVEKMGINARKRAEKIFGAELTHQRVIGTIEDLLMEPKVQ